jgi:hypothetical protein
MKSTDTFKETLMKKQLSSMVEKMVEYYRINYGTDNRQLIRILLDLVQNIYNLIDEIDMEDCE